jgi:hypothetical protein
VGGDGKGGEQGKETAEWHDPVKLAPIPRASTGGNRLARPFDPDGSCDEK